MYQGSCLCGNVKIDIKSAITSIIHCHCSLCRKSSGTAFATNGFVLKKDFVIIDEKDCVANYEVSAGKHRYFCSNCASPLYSYNANNPEYVRVRLGIIDSDINERPMSHNFVSSKANWEELTTSLPCYDRHEPSRKNIDQSIK